MIKLQDLKDVFGNHPIIEQLERSKADELLEKRVKAAATIKALETERGGAIPKLRDELQEKEVLFKEVQVHHNSVIQACRGAWVALMNKSNEFDRLIGQQQEILLLSYDPVIDQAIEWFDLKIQWLQQPGRSNSQVIRVENNILSWEKEILTVSNHQEILDAMGYSQKAIKELENMKLLPLVDPLYIESLKAGLPSIDMFEEIKGKKPLATGQESLIPPSDYEIASLHRRANSLIYNEKVADFYFNEKRV